MADLKLCPFCGGEAEVREVQLIAPPYVMCSEGCCETRVYPTRQAAIEAWNTRATDDRFIHGRELREFIEREGRKREAFVTGTTVATDSPEVRYVPERTCRRVDPADGTPRPHNGFCSVCDYPLADADNYCGACGAKVVE